MAGRSKHGAIAQHVQSKPFESRFPGKIAKTRDNTSGYPPNHNGNNAESNFFSDGSGGRRNVDKMMQLDTVENCVADADVREVHAEGLAAVDTWPSLLICSPHACT
ncbi:hypothetical protein N7532_005076 [Penicillium argentinense]|uniref:Uncharacterized protein n=1 Tax=Penicillium argentinense TaxID=1131581 RepID=A0A9W9FD76_9EURO|nr:uncharacterized protein N7532_005076 [Penicillium argentinense]KAJ5098075.1 hypothetical protein N7532_005076 [Penicillium argentinense]